MPTAAAREQIEADVMREHDENIRLYTPILQRIIVLVAVIIAVPVVLWTITAFVRAYIGPPQLPTFRPMAALPAPPAAPNVQVAVQSANTTTATDARATLLEIKKPSDPAAAVASTASVPALAPAPPPPIPAQIATVPPPPFAAANPNTGGSTSKMPATVAAPPGIAPASVAPASTASIAAANATQPAAPAPDASTSPSVPAMSAPAMAWPSPTAFNPSSPPTDTVASAEQATVVDDADNLAAGMVLRGKIPLPPQRPKVTPQVATTPNVKLATAAMSPSGPTPSSVPLPRARPASAPEPAPVEPPYRAYDPSALH
jgi:hypothetical protein